MTRFVFYVYRFSLYTCTLSHWDRPVRIRVRIDPPHPPCVVRGGPSDETWKTEVPCHSRCATIKMPPSLKALSAEHRPKLCRPSSAMVTSPYKWQIHSAQGAQGLWAGRDLFRATPAVTRGLSFSGLIRRTSPFSHLLRHTRGLGESILTQILTGPYSIAFYDTQGDVEDLI
jgi:hypothetical protein